MDHDYAITITYANGQFSASPLGVPPQGIILDIDDSIIFDVQSRDCRVCFSPKDVFGSHLRLHRGARNSVTPSRTNVTVYFDIVDYDVRCPNDDHIRSYSIKVGN
jgi:hypothetical protein